MLKLFNIFTKQYDWAFDDNISPGRRGIRAILLAAIHGIFFGILYAIIMLITCF